MEIDTVLTDAFESSPLFFTSLKYASVLKYDFKVKFALKIVLNGKKIQKHYVI